MRRTSKVQVIRLFLFSIVLSCPTFYVVVYHLSITL